MLLFYSSDKVTKLVDREREVLDHFVQGRREGLVVKVGEDVFHPAVLKEILLDAQGQVQNAVWGVRVPVWFLDLTHKHAQSVAELVAPQLEDVGLKVLEILSLVAQLLNLNILLHHPVLPGINTVSELEK